MATRRWLAPLGVIAALALILAWWRPWQAPAAPIAPTPRPPTATRAPERIALPTVRPQPSGPPPVSATGTPVVASPTMRAASPAVPIAAGGTLFYLGTIDGRSGVATGNADGSGQRLVAPGLFISMAVSPNGTRIAVVSPIVGGGGAHQLAILDADGRALARYPFGRGTHGALDWSPSGRYLLTALPVGEHSPQWEIRVFGDDGALLITPPAPSITFPYGWVPGDRIAFLTNTDPDRPNEYTLWTSNAAGGDVQAAYEGSFIPIGWRWDGRLIYALASDRPGDPNAILNRLIAIELPWGSVRFLASAENLAASALGVPNAPRAYGFDFAVPSPDGTQFALGIAQNMGVGTPRPRSTAVIFMRIDSQITGVAPLPPGDMRGPSDWSPDGSHFALVVSGEREGDGLLLALDTTGNRRAAFFVERAYLGNFPSVAWSRDGQQLAYTDARGLSIATPGAGGEALLIPGGDRPAWRP